MMTFFYRFKCSVCKDKIGDKTHEWCLANGINDVCYDHIPPHLLMEITEKRYKKSNVPFALNK